MVHCFTRQNRIKMLFMSIIATVIFCVAGFSSLPDANAQLPFLYPSFWNSPVTRVPTYLYNYLPNNYLPTLSNQLRSSNWGIGNGLLTSAPFTAAQLPISPIRSAQAYINGVTTVFVPPSATSLKVSIKQPGSTIPGIKLSGLAPPVTVFIYPSGYVPPAPVAPVTTPATILPTTTTAPAAISAFGGLRRFNPTYPSYGSIYPSYSPIVSYPWAGVRW